MNDRINELGTDFFPVDVPYNMASNNSLFYRMFRASFCLRGFSPLTTHLGRTLVIENPSPPVFHLQIAPKQLA